MSISYCTNQKLPRCRKRCKRQHITRSYKYKKQKVIQRLRLYVAGNNLLTMTGYKGLDPEVSIKGLAPGVEGSGAGELYPTTRQFTVGLNLLF